MLHFPPGNRSVWRRSTPVAELRGSLAGGGAIEGRHVTFSGILSPGEPGAAVGETWRATLARMARRRLVPYIEAAAYLRLCERAAADRRSLSDYAALVLDVHQQLNLD